jgi:hypothetical protein
LGLVAWGKPGGTTDQPTNMPNEITDKFVTKDQLEVALGRLENRLIERFNAIEAKIIALEGKFNSQRTLLIVAILGVLAQIVNAWILHK